MECIATFDTTHMALYFEKACRAEGLSVKIVPVPRSISASCGLAWGLFAFLWRLLVLEVFLPEKHR